MEHTVNRRRFLGKGALLAGGAAGGGVLSAATGRPSQAQAEPPVHDAEARLKSLKLDLPEVPPSPASLIVPCVRAGDLLFVSGHTSVGADGKTIAGRLGKDMDAAATSPATATEASAPNHAMTYVPRETERVTSHPARPLTRSSARDHAATPALIDVATATPRARRSRVAVGVAGRSAAMDPALTKATRMRSILNVIHSSRTASRVTTIAWLTARPPHSVRARRSGRRSPEGRRAP